MQGTLVLLWIILCCKVSAIKSSSYIFFITIVFKQHALMGRKFHIQLFFCERLGEHFSWEEHWFAIEPRLHIWNPTDNITCELPMASSIEGHSEIALTSWVNTHLLYNARIVNANTSCGGLNYHDYLTMPTLINSYKYIVMSFLWEIDTLQCLSTW